MLCIRTLGKTKLTVSLGSDITCIISGFSIQLFSLRACLHGGGGPQVGEVTRVGGATCQSIYSLILI